VADAIAGSGIPARSPIEIWFQDEMRVGQKNGLVYQWAKKGTRPRQPKDQRYANAYVFGAICPARDTGTALVLPCANVGAMQHHLDEISRCVATGAHAVLTLDKAGWHTTRKLQVPSNISLLHLPPASPELNPTENIWQYLRQSYLSNRVFRDYDDVVEASSSAWNKLTAEHGRIASIGTRSWTSISQGP
jgi:DDE superfamily endonuclease